MESEEDKKIILGTFYLFVSQLITVIISLINSMIVVPLLGSYFYGFWVAINLIINYVINFLNLGLSNSLIKYIPHLIAEKRENEVKKHIRVVFSIILSLGSSVTIFLIIFAQNISNILSYSANFTYFLQISLLTIPFYIVWNNLTNVFISHQKYFWIFLINLIFQLNYIFLAIYLVYNGYQLYSLIFAFLSANILSFFISIIIYRIKIQPNYKNLPPPSISTKAVIKNLIKFSIWIYISLITSFLIYNANVSMISIFLTPSELGCYGLALNISKIIDYFSLSYQTTLLPVFSVLIVKNDNKKIKEIHYNNYRIIIISIIFGILLIGFSNLFVPIIWGTEFLPSILPLKILTFAFIFLALYRPIAAFSFGSGKIYINTIIGIIVILTIVGSGFIFIQNYGIIGTALTSLIGYVIGLILWIIIAKYTFKIAILPKKLSIKSIFYLSMLFLLFYISIFNDLFCIIFSISFLIGIIIIEREIIIWIIKAFLHYFVR